RPSFARESKGSELGTKQKVSTGRGVLQNFRGLFAKHKADGSAEAKSRLSEVKAPANGVASPRRDQTLNNAPSRVFNEAGARNASTHQSHEHPTRTIRPVYSTSR